MTPPRPTTAEELYQQGLDRLAAGEPARAARLFRAAIGAALALAALTPADPLAHTALSLALQRAGHVPEAEAAAARARVLEWKMQLENPPGGDLLA